MDTKQKNVITLENVWKIFGENADKALIAARDQGLSKNDILLTMAVLSVSPMRA